MVPPVKKGKPGRMPNYLDLSQHPQLAKQIKATERFFLSSTNLKRDGDRIQESTWEKVKLHTLSK